MKKQLLVILFIVVAAAILSIFFMDVSDLSTEQYARQKGSYGSLAQDILNESIPGKARLRKLHVQDYYIQYQADTGQNPPFDQDSILVLINEAKNEFAFEERLVFDFAARKRMFRNHYDADERYLIKVLDSNWYFARLWFN